MSDLDGRGPDHSCLFDAASEQHGYFTVDQAHACGFTWRNLLYHAKRGRFMRVRRGVYRLRDYPSSSREEIVAAWLAAGREHAAISHESALDLLGLSDVIPSTIHIIVPRARRGLHPPLGVTVHTARRWLRPDEITTIDGIAVTTAARSIIDAAEAGTGPEQIEMAVAQALARGIATPDELREQTLSRGDRVSHAIARALPSQIRASAHVHA